MITLDEDKKVIFNKVQQVFNPPKVSDNNLDNMKKLVRYNSSIINIVDTIGTY